jgi:hypothetical protein
MAYTCPIYQGYYYVGITYRTRDANAKVTLGFYSVESLFADVFFTPPSLVWRTSYAARAGNIVK